MKEKPILFSGEMVRVILSGAKTQTRRVVKLKDIAAATTVVDSPFGSFRLGACPYGQPGDRLWVKETFGLLTGAGHRYVYRADGMPMQHYYPDEPIKDMKWKPSIFMPRRLSRITLEVIGVRVERLQDISEEDAQAEGVERNNPDDHGDGWIDYLDMANGGEGFPAETARESFRTLWDSINAKRAPWVSNPFVWCITFKRVQP